MEQELRTNVLLLVDRFCLFRKLRETTIGKQALSNHRFIPALRSGSAMSVRNYDRLVVWFRANWPEELAWPEHIKVPELAEQEKPRGK